MSTLADRTYTPDDLLAMPDGKGFELVDGHLVERPMGALSSWVAGRIFRKLDEHIEAGGLGYLWPADNGFQCFPHDPMRVRRPDVSFVRRGRLPDDDLDVGFVKIAPDLVVEVLSPNDLAPEVERKVEDYLEAGVPLIWVIDPETQTARVHRADGTAARLRGDDELSGEDVVPGFRCALKAIFPPVQGAT